MNSDNKKNTIRRQFSGTVVSAAMNKTVVVNIESRKLHPKYKKYYRVNKKYHVHDEKGTAKTGDKVVFVECRPISKTKRWRLVSVAS
ncbi:MAG: 30S ribosomal protein S17 [Candidatus Magasanikbacteria bacterium]|nr:30S ribosomal protein S17 [Candidatus Magasanikbacteria bacterium]